jgi:hypothetical protein
MNTNWGLIMLTSYFQLKILSYEVNPSRDVQTMAYIEYYILPFKRTQHNVLERKRRNDLKFSFFTLRDSVPELNKQERAPKVLILKKASDYVHSLNVENKRLENEKEALLAKQQKLRRTV